MFIYVTQRSQIQELLLARRLPSRKHVQEGDPLDLPKLEKHEVAAVWPLDPAVHQQIPDVLVTANGQERDWLAWFATFAPTFRPFTAFCRILGASDFNDYLEARTSPNLGRLGNACVGLIFGEIFSSEGISPRHRDVLTVSACESTFSFALARSLALYKRSVLSAGELSLRWSRVRHLTKQRNREEPRPSEVSAVVEVLAAIQRKAVVSEINLPILRACEEIVERGELRSADLLMNSWFHALNSEMGGTREERVAAFERALELPLSFDVAHEESFALGYLASRINPGTLTHAPLLAPALRNRPSAMLWYGVCAGLSAESGFGGDLGGLGRRVLRELLSPDEFVARPRVDVSWGELEVLLGGERSDEFPVTSPNQLSVELEPGVWTKVNWSSRARTRRPPDDGDRPDERVWIAQELASTISRLMDLQQRIRGGETESGHEQRHPIERGRSRRR